MKATNFDIRITPAMALYILSMGLDTKCRITLMCKEYGDDTDWCELNADDIDEEGKLDDSWKTIEIWLSKPESKTVVLDLIEIWRPLAEALEVKS